MRAAQDGICDGPGRTLSAETRAWEAGHGRWQRRPHTRSDPDFGPARGELRRSAERAHALEHERREALKLVFRDEKRVELQRERSRVAV